MLVFIGFEDEFNKFRPMGQITLSNVVMAIQNEISKLSTFDNIDCLEN